LISSFSLARVYWHYSIASKEHIVELYVLKLDRSPKYRHLSQALSVCARRRAIPFLKLFSLFGLRVLDVSPSE
jgi:hypothetical protein